MFLAEDFFPEFYSPGKNSGKKFSYGFFFREFIFLRKKTPALFLPNIAKTKARVLRVAQNSLPLTSIVQIYKKK